MHPVHPAAETELTASLRRQVNRRSGEGRKAAPNPRVWKDDLGRALPALLPVEDEAERPQTRGCTATKDQVQDRLARIEGQVRGVAKMVEEDRYCIDVVTQINAARAGLDKVALGLLDGYVRHRLMGGADLPTPDEQAEELMRAVGRLLSR